MTRGVPPAYAAPPLAQQMVATTEEPMPVWPDPEGEARGLSFAPLHKNAPKAAHADNKFYELLALTDALRSGRAREREIAAKELHNRLEQYASAHQSQY